MTRICFVSYEIHPTTLGGVGVLLYNAAQVLLEQGHEIIFLLDISELEFTRFMEHDRLNFPNYKNCKAYHVAKLCEDIPYQLNDFISSYAWNSYRFHFSSSKIYHLDRPDIFEFFDYCGIAHYALSAKICGLEYADSQMVVRLHNSNEVMNINEPRSIDADYYTQFGLEHHALRLAETIVYPSDNYLSKAYKPVYPEQWYGKLIRSTPPIIDFPHKGENAEDQNIILFLNRLYSFKGVDKFIDASVILLSQEGTKHFQFYLLGHDSMRPPTGIIGQSYEEYLLQRIPFSLRPHFKFVGALSWQEIEELLPKVRFAVFPNYFESFCYSAHELYAAGVPLIINDIAAFQDYFKHEENSLVFDGSVQDLVKQMLRLITEPNLINKFSFPYPIANSAMDNFYETGHRSSWINQIPSFRQQISLLICIVSDTSRVDLDVTQTLAKLEDFKASAQIVTLDLIDEQNSGNIQAFSWLGKLYTVKDLENNFLSPGEINTANALLILRAGDLPDQEFIQRSLMIIENQPQIAFVGCWHEIQNGENVFVNTLPVDAMSEIVPFLTSDPLNRMVMRTQPDKLLIDLFDSRSGSYGEIQYLWKLDNGEQCGIVIPKILLRQVSFTPKSIPEPILSYLITQNQYPFRAQRLARYAVVNRKNYLANKNNLIANLDESYSIGWRLRHNIKNFLQKSPFTQRFLFIPIRYIWRLVKRGNLHVENNPQ